MTQASKNGRDRGTGQEGHGFGCPFSRIDISSRNISSWAVKYIQARNTIDHATGSWCQWVLDDACHAFEWLSATRVRFPHPLMSLEPRNLRLT
jgi:hypothetical protein